MDFAGPFFTRQGRGRAQAKQYLALFPCTKTRGCHLEMAYDMTTDAFLLAFDRFCKRRGCPAAIVSDNGRNFIAAEHELCEAVKRLDEAKIVSTTAIKKVTWHFNPPVAPHHGGVFESMTKLAKRAIFAVLKQSSCTDEELLTAFVKAEAMVNSRPITTVSTDAADLEALMPQDFLMGNQSINHPLEAADSAELTVFSEKRWKVVQHPTNAVWERWLKEFVPELNVKQKWLRNGRAIIVGDVVLYMEQGMPRNQWPLGCVTAVHPGLDGVVRVLDIKMQGKSYKRSGHLRRSSRGRE